MPTRVNAITLAVLAAMLCLTIACSRESGETAPSAEVAAAKVVGPDLCKVQLWGAMAFERANGRADDKAAYDRAAWNLTQFKIAQQLTENPDIDKEEAIAEAMKIAVEVYQNPKLAECETP